MTTIKDRIDNWKLAELRGKTQVNDDVILQWYNKGMLIFQKYLLEYASGLINTSQRFQNVVENQDEYILPFRTQEVNNIEDFYSIIQLRVAYDVDKNNSPIFKVVKPLNLGDYNINPAKNIYDSNGNLKVQGGQQIGDPAIWNIISMETPKYVFVNKNTIKIFPTPIKNVQGGLSLTYNYMPQPLTKVEAFGERDEDQQERIHEPIDESVLNLPWYFFDVIDDYLSYRLYLAENPEEAEIYFQTFVNTLHDNIYGINRDQRNIEENFANLSYFYRG